MNNKEPEEIEEFKKNIIEPAERKITELDRDSHRIK